MHRFASEIRQLYVYVPTLIYCLYIPPITDKKYIWPLNHLFLWLIFFASKPMYYGICNVVFCDLSLSANTFPGTCLSRANNFFATYIMLLMIYRDITFLYFYISIFVWFSYFTQSHRDISVFCNRCYGYFGSFVHDKCF